MSKHVALYARRLMAASLFVLVGTTTPVFAEVRLQPLTASTPAVIAQPAPSAAVVKQEIALREKSASGSFLSCSRSGRRMVC